MRQAFRTVFQSPRLRVALALLAAAAGLWFVIYTRGIWLTFLLACLLAYLAQPLMNLCERRLRARWLGLLAVLMGIFLLVGAASLLATDLAEQAARFSRDLPNLVNQAVAVVQNGPAGLQSLSLPPALARPVEQAYRSLGALFAGLSAQLVRTLEGFVTGGGLVSGVGLLLDDVVRLLAFFSLTIYLLLDLPRVGQSLLRAVPRPYQPLAEDLTGKLERSVGGYFRGQLVIALSVGVLVGLGLTLLRVPLALSLGVLAGVFNLVPYLGVVIATVPSLLLAAGLGWPQTLGVVAVFTVVNQLEAHVLSPLVLGRATRLHPVTIVLAILLGARLFGLWGAVLAVPVTAFLKLLYDDFYLTSRFHREG